MPRGTRKPDTDDSDWRDVWRARYDYPDSGGGGWWSRRRLRATTRRNHRQARDAWRAHTVRHNDIPAGAVAMLAVLVAAAGLWFAIRGGHHATPNPSATTAPPPAVTTPTAPPSRPGTSPAGPTGRGQPPRVGPAGGVRPTPAPGMTPYPASTPNPRDANSVAGHVAVDACSYTWTESVTAAFARVTRWMTPAEALRWHPSAADQDYWAGHVVPTHETVTCHITGSTVDGAATATRRGISITLATTRTSDGTTERGVSSYAVLVDRQPGGNWQAAALTATG